MPSSNCDLQIINNFQKLDIITFPCQTVKIVIYLQGIQNNYCFNCLEVFILIHLHLTHEIFFREFQVLGRNSNLKREQSTLQSREKQTTFRLPDSISTNLTIDTDTTIRDRKLTRNENFRDRQERMFLRKI